MPKLKKVVQKPLGELWEEVKEIAGVSYEEFSSYYEGLILGCGIFLDRRQPFSHPIELERLREEWDNFRQPQSFRYLKQREVNIVENMTKFYLDEFAKTCQKTLNIS